MPRPCKKKHQPSPGVCPWCAWCAMPGEKGKAYRQQWGEPEPEEEAVAELKHAMNGERAALAHPKQPPVTVGDLLPGIPDPLVPAWPNPIPEGWAHAGDVRDRHCRAFREMLALDLVAPAGLAGDGIIYVGGGRYWPMIVLGCRMARKFTDLPIQIWHSGPGEPVNPQDVADIPNIQIRDVSKIGFPRLRIGGWENKTTAILFSGFSRVFYLDADAYLVGDPSAVLDAASKSRFAFWCDLPWNDGTVDWHWLGVSNAGVVPPIQGGQLAIDVVAFYRELVLSDWINQHSPYTYQHQYGDQDSWRVALAATGGHYHNLGAAGWQPPAFVCRYPEPLVVHRCQAKLWGDCQVNFAHDLPWEGEVRKFYNDQVVGRGSAAEVFARIYRVGMWGQAESSGAGGTDHESQPWIDLLLVLRRLSGWDSCVDLGCGDGRVTRRLPFHEITGVDCYQTHIDRLRKEAKDITWLVYDLDIERDELPCGDVCLMKDVLHHWPSALIVDWVRWAYACGKWKYVVFSHDCHQQEDGGDCILGGYRALNPSMKPLLGLDLVPVSQYLHKQVVLLECHPA